MLKRVSVWTAVAVVLVLALQLSLRERAAPVEAPPRPGAPREQLPVVDPPDSLPAPRNADPTLTEPAEVVASNEPAVAGFAPEVRASRDRSRRFRFACANGPSFAVDVRDDKATVISLDNSAAGSLTLPRTEAAAGERYAAGDTVYWRNGDVATFEIRGQAYSDCVSSPGLTLEAEARRRGVTFMARGNEPSWTFEIRGDGFGLGAGGRRLDFPLRAPTVSGPRTTYRTFLGTQELVVIIDAVACNDSRSGELYDNTVSLTFEGETVYGCGRAPRLLP